MAASRTDLGELMRPRVLLRTHYQANEPRLIIATVTRASSPVVSRSDDTVAAALERWARDHEYKISTPGAIYAVDNARHLGLLNGSNHWTSAGLAFAFLETLIQPAGGPGSRALTSVEERLYMERYLVGGGALLIKFARWLLQHKTTTGAQLRDQEIIEQLLVEVLDDYLRIAYEARDRSAIRRERDRLKKVQYTALTKRHKRYPLLRTMARLRLLGATSEDEELNQIEPDREGRLKSLSRAIPDIETLERLIRDGKLRETLDMELGEYSRIDLPKESSLTALLLGAYSFAIHKGLQACPLAFLDHILAAVSPASPKARRVSAEELLEPIHKAEPRDVRFHVDRQGRRAFVLISTVAQDRMLALEA